ncbi:MAG: hypothetical protein HY901_09315 [Deltaproteobacteria bacterium]|nr:hypothetical protein [Deltaproteobacteria bacterium]
MSSPAPSGAQCAAHPEAAASWVCGRCGTFMCPECEHRVRPEAHPLCPSCWELRERTLATLHTEKGGTRLQTAGLILGVISLAPGCFPLQLLSLVLNIVAIARAPHGARWRPIVGLVLTLLGSVGSLLFYFFPRS